MGIPSLTVTNVPGSPFTWSHPYCCQCRSRNCRSINSRLILPKSQPLPFSSQKRLVKQWQWKSKPLTCLHVSYLSWLSLVESTLSCKKNWLDAKVRALLETTRNAFYIGRGQDYGSHEASLKLKEISLHPMWRFRGWRTRMVLPWLKRESVLAPPCQIQFLATTPWKYPRSGSSCVLRSYYFQKKMLPKTWRSFCMTVHPTTNLNGQINATSRLLLQPYTVDSMWTNHVTLLSKIE